MKLKIVNRSGWPDWFAGPVARWIASRVQPEAEQYTLVLPSHASRDGFSGTGRTKSSRVRINRRMRGPFPYTTRYWRYRWSTPFDLRCRVEAWVYIVAHEMCHAAQGRRSKWRQADGRADVASMEATCERIARQAVEAFRIEWPKRLRARCMEALRRERQQQARRRARRSDPARKLADAEAMAKRWRAKLRLAKTKLKKYERRAAYYAKRRDAMGD